MTARLSVFKSLPSAGPREWFVLSFLWVAATILSPRLQIICAGNAPVPCGAFFLAVEKVPHEHM